MSRLKTVRENRTDITAKLLHDKQVLAHFLRFSVGMYNQSFSDAALIYQQNPNATKVFFYYITKILGLKGGDYLTLTVNFGG